MPTMILLNNPALRCEMDVDGCVVVADVCGDVDEIATCHTYGLISLHWWRPETRLRNAAPHHSNFFRNAETRGTTTS